MGRGGGSTANGKNHLNFLFRLVEHLPKTSQMYCRNALYCPQVGGMLRQQILMKHGIAWYCMVLHIIALFCIVLCGVARYCTVLHGIAWYFMALHGFLLQHLLVSGGQSFPCFVKILFCKLVNDFSFPDKAQF